MEILQKKWEIYCNEKDLDQPLRQYYWIARLHAVAHIQQVGPTCGIAAVLMAKRYLSGCGQEEQEKKSTLLADTLETAQSLGLTRRGEFFIHTHLATLCKTVCSGMDTGRVIQLSSAMDVVATLHNGGVLATVYDADGNHEPCLKEGSKAHWCLIIGYIHPLTTAAQSAGINSSNPHHRLTTQPFQHPRHLSIHSSPPNTPQPPPSNITPSLLYLITTHGKSKHYAIWKYSLLLESNLNLIRANPLLSPNDYLLPDSGCLLPLRNIAMAFFHNI